MFGRDVTHTPELLNILFDEMDLRLGKNIIKNKKRLRAAREGAERQHKELTSPWREEAAETTYSSNSAFFLVLYTAFPCYCTSNK